MREKLEEAEATLRAAHLRAGRGDRASATRRAIGRARVEAQLVGLRAEAAALVDRSAARERTISTPRAPRSGSCEAAPHERASSNASASATTPDGERGEEERAALEAELARVRERNCLRARAAQSATNARGAELRERAAALTAERDAAQARLGMLDQDSERGGLAREEMLAQIAALVEETRTRARARRRPSPRHRRGRRVTRNGAARARRGWPRGRRSCETEARAAEQAERDTAAGGERDRTRLAQVEAELGMLVSQFAQNPATNDECADVETRYRDEPDAVVDELPRLRDELARLQANVNLNAESERAEVAEREAFLRGQMDDLAKARETLLESIREIERETQVQFNETFERVSEAFAGMYGRLFAGGEAKMWQTQPENLSETGIEIAVRPPGKKAMPLAALSGGERAMTAAALIFALIATKPAPFYLLDEVDAALDDANIDRFCAMVREFAAESQMLIVTHNKKTMEMADRIYGVTTRDAGVSAIVSAELVREAEALLA